MPYIIPNTTAIPQTVFTPQIVVNGTTCTWPSDKIVEGVKVIHHIECSIGCENTGAAPAELKITLQRDIGSGWADVAGEVACYTIAAGDDARRKANFKVPYYTGISGFAPRYRLLAECPVGEVTLHRAEGRDAVPTVTCKQELEFKGEPPVITPVIPLWGPIPDTGQTVQYAVGDDADYGWDVTENNDADGHAGLSYTDLGGGHVRDNRTGLIYIWTGTSGGTWDQDMAAAAAYNGLGRSWRLPTIKELAFAGDYSKPGVKYDPLLGYINAGYNERSSTVAANDNTQVWSYQPSDGYGDPQTSKSSTGHTLVYVSGDELVQDLTDNGDGTITDRNTGFMWTKYLLGGDGVNPPTQINWATAVANALACSVGGHSDWRLPNLKELITIIDYTKTIGVPAINTGYFSQIPVSAWVWSSTTSIGNIARAWMFDLTYMGFLYPLSKSRDSTMYAFAVRNT